MTTEIETLKDAVFKLEEAIRLSIERGHDGVVIYRHDAKTVLEAAKKVLAKAGETCGAYVGEGWVAVPREPTNAMISEGIIERHTTGVPEAWSKATANIYRAMISAAPKPTQR
jgi:hypothetical protein